MTVRAFLSRFYGQLAHDLVPEMPTVLVAPPPIEQPTLWPAARCVECGEVVRVGEAQVRITNAVGCVHLRCFRGDA